MPATPSNIISNGVDLSMYGDGATFQNADKKFVVRYVSPNTTNIPHKRLTRAEIDDYFAHDLSICVVWETITTRATAGYSAGKVDAAAAHSVVVGLGLPTSMPVYLAIDSDLTGSAVEAYFQGASDTIGLARVGAYGGIKPLKYLFDNHRITYGWQTFAWSNGLLDPRCQAYQHMNNVFIGRYNVDLNYQLAHDFGQVNPDGTLGDVANMPTLDSTDIANVAAATAKSVWETLIQNNVLGSDGKPIGPTKAQVFVTSMNTELHDLRTNLVPQVQADVDAIQTSEAAASAKLDAIEADLATMPNDVADAVIAKLPADMQGMTPDQFKQIVIDGTTEVVNNTTAKLTVTPPTE